MNNYNLGLIKAILTLSILDFIYLKSSSSLYSKLINKIQKSPMSLRMYSVIIVYILIFLMWIIFIYNKKDQHTLKENILRSFLLGLLTYGIYEGTNRAIFSKWSLDVMLIDSLWGGILFSLVYIISKKIDSYYK